MPFVSQTVLFVPLESIFSNAVFFSQLNNKSNGRPGVIQHGNGHDGPTLVYSLVYQGPVKSFDCGITSQRKDYICLQSSHPQCTDT